MLYSQLHKIVLKGYRMGKIKVTLEDLRDADRWEADPNTPHIGKLVDDVLLTSKFMPDEALKAMLKADLFNPLRDLAANGTPYDSKKEIEKFMQKTAEIRRLKKEMLDAFRDQPEQAPLTEDEVNDLAKKEGAE